MNQLHVLIVKIMAEALLRLLLVSFELSVILIHWLCFLTEIFLKVWLTGYLSQSFDVVHVNLLLHVNIVDFATALRIVHRFLNYIAIILGLTWSVSGPECHLLIVILCKSKNIIYNGSLRRKWRKCSKIFWGSPKTKHRRDYRTYQSQIWLQITQIAIEGTRPMATHPLKVNLPQWIWWR